MIAVWGCLLALLLDTFDRFERRYAIDQNFGDSLPKRGVSWGFYGERSGWARNFAKRYFVLRLPSREWAYDPCYDEYGWGQHHLMYVSGRGWSLRPIFDARQYRAFVHYSDSVYCPPEGYKGW